MTPFLFTQTQAIAAGLALTLYLAAAFVPLLALGRVALMSRGPLHGHLARQLLRLQGVLALVPALSAVSLLAFGSGAEFSLPEPLLPQVRLAAGLIGVGVALSWILPLCWPALKKQPALLLLLTLVLTLCFWGAVWPVLSLAESGWLLRGGLAPLLERFTDFSLPLINTTFHWRMDTVLAALFWLMGPAMAGSFALLWLLIRRNRDDFGRDYYTFAARVCASFAAGGGLLAIMCFTACTKVLLSILPPVEAQAPMVLPAWLTSAGTLFQSLLGAESTTRWGLDALSPGLGLLCLLPPLLAACAALLLFMVARNALPMRCKISMTLAPVLLLLAVSLTCVLFGLAHALPAIPAAPLP